MLRGICQFIDPGFRPFPHTFHEPALGRLAAIRAARYWKVLDLVRGAHKRASVHQYGCRSGYQNHDTTPPLSCPTELLFTSTDFNSYVTTSIAHGAPQRQNGRLAASREPGLGITPKFDVLGDPVLTVDQPA